MSATVPDALADLPTYTRAQAALYATAAEHFTFGPFFRQCAKQVEQILSEALREKVQLANPKPGHELMTGRQLYERLPQHACMAWFQLEGTQAPMLWEIHPELAAWMLDKLLGGDGSGAVTHQPLTEMGCGILTYLVLKVIYLFNEQQVISPRQTLLLDQFNCGLEHAAGLREHQTMYHVVRLPMQCGKHHGSIRLCVPSEGINTFAGGRTTASSRGESLWLAPATWALLEQYSTPLILQIAPLDLLPQDLNNVDVGDIVLLEHHQLKLQEQQLQGQLRARLGLGQTGTLRGELVRPDLTLDSLAFQLQSIDVSEVPEQKVVPLNDSTTEVNTIEPVQQTLLQEIQTPMVVELSRLRLTAAEVARLRIGQTLPLSRTSRDPVDLVVGQTCYARGELVNVDGELGVRLLEIMPGGQPIQDGKA